MRYTFVALLFSLGVTPSLQSCPPGWRQATVDPNKCYLVVVSKKIWFEAGAHCASAASNGFLTSIASAFESFSLSAVVTDTPSISSCDQMWIGANDFDQNGQFVWTDNHRFQYSNWGSAQPDLGNQCVSSQARTTGKWKTEPCGIENCFICETYMSSSGSSTIPPTSPPMTTTSAAMFSDCYDWLHYGGATSDGIYSINPNGSGPFSVYCDMTTNEGGWTLFQKRVDDSLTFYSKTWFEYKNGFDNGLQRNHWLGLEKLHLLSMKDASVTLRIDLKGDRCHSLVSHEGTCSPVPMPSGYWWGEYVFSVGGQSSSYRLQTTAINAGNLTRRENDGTSGFSFHNGAMFSTIDQDNSGHSCAFVTQETGGWWNSNCNTIALNGKYVPDPNFYGLYSETFYDSQYDILPVITEMKLRKNVN